MPPEFSTRESPSRRSRGGWLRGFSWPPKRPPLHSRGARSNDFAAMQGGEGLFTPPSRPRSPLAFAGAGSELVEGQSFLQNGEGRTALRQARGKRESD